MLVAVEARSDAKLIPQRFARKAQARAPKKLPLKAMKHVLVHMSISECIESIKLHFTSLHRMSGIAGVSSGVFTAISFALRFQ